ncbi:hypothetical protein [Alistipes finegoldii]|uniref:hypothetical protein n=2 Tax=Rikenellaceae TaxID=171550 RepID=UPI00242B476F|nr:hypothetical protein [Alistipes finegoldii]
MYYPYSEVERLPAGNGILPQAGFTAMRKWIDQSTFDELLLANAEDNVERTIQSASAVLKIVQKFVPEAALFYRVTHAADSLKNYFEEACTGFRRNGILFLVRQYFYPKLYYDLRFDWSLFRYADNYSYGKAFDKQSEPNRIGVFTKKKIDDWVKYLTQGFRNLERINAENERKMTGYRNRLEAIPDVVWNKDKSRGHITRHGLTYTFEIRQTDYSEKISLDYRCRTLDDFLALSDNKLILKP